jgi:hypothetical protein
VQAHVAGKNVVRNACRTKSPSFPPVLVGETRFVRGWALEETGARQRKGVLFVLVFLVGAVGIEPYDLSHVKGALFHRCPLGKYIFLLSLKYRLRSHSLCYCAAGLLR